MTEASANAPNDTQQTNTTEKFSIVFQTPTEDIAKLVARYRTNKKNCCTSCCRCLSFPYRNLRSGKTLPPFLSFEPLTGELYTNGKAFDTGQLDNLVLHVEDAAGTILEEIDVSMYLGIESDIDVDAEALGLMASA